MDVEIPKAKSKHAFEKGFIMAEQINQALAGLNLPLAVPGGIS